MTSGVLMNSAFIGYGSNLGDSRALIRRALIELSSYGPVRSSGLYRSRPVGPQDQPDFWNGVAQLQTTLEPLALLDVLQALEQQAGRERLRHWGERTLDLDLLLYGNACIQTPRLTVPHLQLQVRSFVLMPLLELAPDLAVDGTLLSSLPAATDSTGITRVDDQNWWMA